MTRGHNSCDYIQYIIIYFVDADRLGVFFNIIIFFVYVPHIIFPAGNVFFFSFEVLNLTRVICLVIIRPIPNIRNRARLCRRAYVQRARTGNALFGLELLLTAGQIGGDYRSTWNSTNRCDSPSQQVREKRCGVHLEGIYQYYNVAVLFILYTRIIAK